MQQHDDLPHGGARPMMPTTLQLLRSQWIQAIALWQLHEDAQTLYAAINSERRYVFAWRRWRHLSCHGRPKTCVKSKDPAIGWTVVVP